MRKSHRYNKRRSMDANCLRVPSRMNLVLDGLRSKLYEVIHDDRTSMAWDVNDTEDTGSEARRAVNNRPAPQQHV